MNSFVEDIFGTESPSAKSFGAFGVFGRWVGVRYICELWNLFTSGFNTESGVTIIPRMGSL